MGEEKSAKITVIVETEDNTRINIYHEVHGLETSQDLTQVITYSDTTPDIIQNGIDPKVGVITLALKPHRNEEGIYLTVYDKKLMGEEDWVKFILGLV